MHIDAVRPRAAMPGRTIRNGAKSINAGVQPSPYARIIGEVPARAMAERLP
ncbi:hypothetical protein [Sphingobium psychrophilum]|nr:hypothetical protein [Sphingobium psychrophilum]